MYIDVVPNRGSRPAVLLREGWREGGKTHLRTLANLSEWPEDKIESLRRLLKGEALVSPGQAFQIERSRPHGHVVAVLGSMKKIGLDTLLASRPCRERDLVMAMIAERLIHPCSKLATVRLWHATTLAEELKVEDGTETDLYKAMDWLIDRQGRIEKKLAARHFGEDALVYYDISSSYYEGRTCPLAKFGHSRDGKKGLPIIVYGVLTDAEGRPVAVQVYPGNTGDPKTVPDQVDKLRRRFGLQRVVLVGDRGMLTQVQIDQFKEHPGLGWISALRYESIRRLVSSGALSLSVFDLEKLAEITSPDFPGERLIVCFNPDLAKDRRRTREELLDATREKLQKIAKEVERRKKTPLTASEIGRKVGLALKKYKMGKHFEIKITDNFLSFSQKEASIGRERDLDGIYVIRTSESAERLSDQDVVRGYKALAKVERVFRGLKSLDIQVRPIWHREERRVRCHIFICILANYLEWHMRRALAPLLFEDEDKERERLNRHPVDMAEPSASAKRKKQSKKTAAGLPVHSFETLMAELAAMTKNRCRVKSDPAAPAFDQISLPTEIQRQALQYLKLFS